MLGDHKPHARIGADKAPTRAMSETMLAPTAGYPFDAWDDVDEQAGTKFDIRTYIRIIMRHWLVIVASLVLAIAAGVAITLLTTPIYTATTTLQIDREAARVGNLQTFEAKEQVSNGSDEFFQTQFALLKSRSLAEATAKDPALNLAHDKEFLKGLGVIKDGQPPLTTAEGQIAVANYISANLQVAPVQRSRIVALSVDSPNAVASARLVNAVADNFIRQTLKRRVDASSYGVAFLQEQLASERASLEQSERELAEYAREEQIINLAPSASTAGGEGTRTGSSQGNQTLAATSLSAMEGALNVARSERIAAQQRLEIGRKSIGPNSPEVLQSGVVQTLKQERAAKQSEYVSNLTIYQPNAEPMRMLSGQIEDLDRRIAAEVNSIKSSLTIGLQSQYDIAAGQEQKLSGEVARLTKNVLGLRESSIRYDILQRDIDTKRQLYDNLLHQYKEIGVSSNLQTNNISVVDRAQPPGGPSKPRPARNITLSILLGLALGIGLALLLELLDESIRTPEDVERKLGLPLLGSIPRLEKGVTPAMALGDLRSAFSEAYYSVRTALQFSTNQGVPSSLAVTSARPSEGKSTTSVALAKNFARLGARVLLIDADLRNPSLHRVLQTENDEGFSNYLTGGGSLIQFAKPTDSNNLFFIPCGPLPPNPAELLAGQRMREMLEEARQTFDMVILDCPPVMGLADAPLLASSAAGTVLVVEAGGTGRHLAKGSIRRLGVGHARLLGVLLTKFDARRSSQGYGYGYGYSYEYAYGSNVPAVEKK